MQKTMKDSHREFRFFATYETASWIEAAASDPDSFDEVPWEFNEIAECLGKFSKSSILHRYIYSALYVEKHREYRKIRDPTQADDIDGFRKAFNDYSIALKDDKSFAPDDTSAVPEDLSEYARQEWGDHYEECDYFFRWFLFHETSFEALWDKITDEVFHLLFANRGFLFTFNKSLAAYLEHNTDRIPPKYRNKGGRVKRSKYIPSWTKKAVFFRDRGRCVHCLRDLSGLLSTDRDIHYDHMVPLNLWGVNDPCNLQLLCQECNLTKSDNKASTGIRYEEWW